MSKSSQMSTQGEIACVELMFLRKPSCIGDIAPSGGDGMIGIDDLLAIIGAWGLCQ